MKIRTQYHIKDGKRVEGKAILRLRARQKAHELLVAHSRNGGKEYTRPGSMK